MDKIRVGASVAVKLPEGARILIVGEDEAVNQQLRTTFQGAGLVSETAKSITSACQSAKSGRFQALVSTPVLRDGSWRRLVDIAKHYELGFEVVVMARHFDLLEWSEALRDGAFDVIDAASELPIASETMKRALWAAYLKGAWPGISTPSPQKAA
jgi:DNA-binding NtrC family response regulator